WRFLHLTGDALDEARLDRQLGGRQLQRLARDLCRHAVDLEQDAAGLDAHNPVFRRALARAHAHLERLLRHRHVRIDADPDLPGALHVARERTASRFDLASGHTLGLHGLEAVMPEGELDARGRNALDPALVRLAELGAHWLQHGVLSL